MVITTESLRWLKLHHLLDIDTNNNSSSGQLISDIINWILLLGATSQSNEMTFVPAIFVNLDHVPVRISYLLRAQQQCHVQQISLSFYSKWAFWWHQRSHSDCAWLDFVFCCEVLVNLEKKMGSYENELRSIVAGMANKLTSNWFVCVRDIWQIRIRADASWRWHWSRIGIRSARSGFIVSRWCSTFRHRDGISALQSCRTTASCRIRSPMNATRSGTICRMWLFRTHLCVCFLDYFPLKWWLNVKIYKFFTFYVSVFLSVINLLHFCFLRPRSTADCLIFFFQWNNIDIFEEWLKQNGMQFLDSFLRRLLFWLGVFGSGHGWLTLSWIKSVTNVLKHAQLKHFSWLLEIALEEVVQLRQFRTPWTYKIINKKFDRMQWTDRKRVRQRERERIVPH